MTSFGIMVMRQHCEVVQSAVGRTWEVQLATGVDLEVVVRSLSAEVGAVSTASIVQIVHLVVSMGFAAAAACTDSGRLGAEVVDRQEAVKAYYQGQARTCSKGQRKTWKAVADKEMLRVGRVAGLGLAVMIQLGELMIVN